MLIPRRQVERPSKRKVYRQEPQKFNFKPSIVVNMEVDLENFQAGLGPLSVETTMYILTFFKRKDLLALCCVSKRMNQLASDDHIWRRLLFYELDVDFALAPEKIPKWFYTVSEWKKETLARTMFDIHIVRQNGEQMAEFKLSEKLWAPLKPFRYHLCATYFYLPPHKTRLLASFKPFQECQE